MNKIILKKIVKFLVVIIIIIVLFFLPIFQRLLLYSTKDNRTSMILKINKQEFIISYIHSVNQSKIRDYYILDKNNNIVLEKTRFVSYGAGIPEPKEDENFVLTDDYMEINNINTIIDNLNLFVGTSANHNIMIDNKIFELDKTFKPQTSIKIEYKKINMFYYLKSYINNMIYD
ncbi:DUF1850 domain-containing protein [Brachyspira alvinipulli]|uniref:DUF1850 domain-containing protein n=1 Tax=Brachyspira alvinipulli TaxID=84379 RepID=UPI003006D56E